MTQKYTILKVLIQNLSKERHSNKGFTLLELIVGMVILVSIIGLAMNAFVEASSTFNKDKKTIDSSQSLSAVLELIGSDIRQAGESINDPKFPVIKIEPNTDSGSMANSSKITIRRALSTPLTLCETINDASTNTNTNTLVVADNSLGTSNCNTGTVVTTTSPPRPQVLRDARDYRCKLDDVNGNYTIPNTDFCSSSGSPEEAQEKVLAAMSDGAGNIRTFEYQNDSEVTANAKYQISIGSTLQASSPLATATYASNTSPIYLIEERVYTLDNQGNLKLKRDRGTPETLIKRMESFKVSARVYGDKKTREPDTINAASPAVAPNLLPLSRRCDPAIPYYICAFNTTNADDWKTLQGVKVELQAKYDGRGGSATPSDTDTEKLSAKAEFFPRNVLSK